MRRPPRRGGGELVEGTEHGERGLMAAQMNTLLNSTGGLR